MSDTTWTVKIYRADGSVETMTGFSEAEAAQHAGLTNRDPDVVRVSRATG